MSTSPENGAGIEWAARVLSKFTRQTGQLLWGIVVHTQHIHRMSDRRQRVGDYRSHASRVRR